VALVSVLVPVLEPGLALVLEPGLGLELGPVLELGPGRHNQQQLSRSALLPP